MIRKLLAGLSGLLLLSPLAMAQTEALPSQLFDRSLRLQGDSIRACVDDFNAGAPIDRAVAQAIGDALLLDVNFVPALRGFPLDGDGYLAELQVHLNNDCDLFMGISVQPNSPFPDWALVTRPYAKIPFVLAVTNPAYNRLADVPKGLFIGTALASLGERVFITAMQQLPKEQRWKRLPYADFKLMLTRMREGKLAGMLLYEPALVKLLADDPERNSIRIIPTDPVASTEVLVGALIPVRNSYLRNQVDSAITTLIEDGTIDQILVDQGIIGLGGD